MKKNLVTRVLRSLAFAVLAAALVPQIAHANSSARGEFTLKTPARWEGIYMPAGTYSYVVDYEGSFSTILVSDVSGRTLGYVVPSVTVSRRGLETTSLELDSEGGKTFVSSMKVGDLGVEFYFNNPRGKAEFAFKGSSTSPQNTAFAAAK